MLFPSPLRTDRRCGRDQVMEEMRMKRISLDLEVEEIENRTKPGCQNSSSTSPLCTCPILASYTN
jgi:hypothetical protein